MAVFEGVDDAVGSAVQTVTEGVVVALVVVISHVKTVSAAFGSWVDRTSLGDLDLFLEADGLTLGTGVGWIVTRVGALVLPTTFSTVLLGEGYGAFTVVPLGHVDVGVEVDLGGRSVTSRVVTLVHTVLDVDLGVGVAAVGLTVGASAGQSV